MLVSLSLVFVKKKRGMGYREKKYGHMKVQVLRKKIERKKYGHMKVHEKKEKKGKKDSHALKRIYIGREIIQKEFSFHPSQSIHVQILI